MKYELTLDGMSCGHCVKAVEEALARVENIQVESVEIGRAIIASDNMMAVQAQISEELEEEGYPLKNAELH
ncbi:MAG: heavy-metal-associated domain-containing protein [Bacteroidetes Order II. Incertae sedis bacterium]|jgi:copper chaperone CopZ|nr:heavy-metal-associated domain-containing protein [Bacteroidetes Order II. bacterium]MDG1754912.1 heavy-metal-associated domain-containing protein [Rhodothermales bacterium]HAY36385.1 copper chaperone [Bacteroidota bacterium]MBT4602260.1 heavy-metal-associated domain-containing protein [Bacteroidetes Order II. bacterium]MBT5250583.1 heavy-metal-associated domain-containing protein [Bacteroidetes Order II. bacterium]